jgi:hypothetical protein
MRSAVLAGALVALSAWTVGARAQDSARVRGSAEMAPVKEYLMDRDAEITLARSAAPTAISAAATILTLTPRGYQTAVRGTNGFTCLVDRQWQAPFSEPNFWDPRVRAPVCFNPQAVRSVLPLQQERTRLALRGYSREQIMQRVKAGRIESGAMAYMMSKDQYLGDPDPTFQPHLMFYAPNTVQSADWGANLALSPIFGTPELMPNGKPEAVHIFVIPVDHWSDGKPATPKPH